MGQDRRAEDCWGWVKIYAETQVSTLIMFKETKKLSGSRLELRQSGRQAEIVMVRGQITPSLSTRRR